MKTPFDLNNVYHITDLPARLYDKEDNVYELRDGGVYKDPEGRLVSLPELVRTGLNFFA